MLCCVLPAGVKVDVVLDRTPFYAESGGQVADTGLLSTTSSSSSSDDAASTSSSETEAVLHVADVQKGAGGRLFVHNCVLQDGSLTLGQQVTAEVDLVQRQRIKAHHTATHLLQSALKQVLGQDTCQQGSLCDANRLRCVFDICWVIST